MEQISTTPDRRLVALGREDRTLAGHSGAYWLARDAGAGIVADGKLIASGVQPCYGIEIKRDSGRVLVDVREERGKVRRYDVTDATPEAPMLDIPISDVVVQPGWPDRPEPPEPPEPEPQWVALDQPGEVWRATEAEHELILPFLMPPEDARFDRLRVTFSMYWPGPNNASGVYPFWQLVCGKWGRHDPGSQGGLYVYAPQTQANVLFRSNVGLPRAEKTPRRTNCSHQLTPGSNPSWEFDAINLDGRFRLSVGGQGSEHQVPTVDGGYLVGPSSPPWNLQLGGHEEPGMPEIHLPPGTSFHDLRAVFE